MYQIKIVRPKWVAASTNANDWNVYRLEYGKLTKPFTLTGTPEEMIIKADEIVENKSYKYQKYAV